MTVFVVESWWKHPGDQAPTPSFKELFATLQSAVEYADDESKFHESHAETQTDLHGFAWSRWWHDGDEGMTVRAYHVKP